jgi:hypothetical protein
VKTSFFSCFFFFCDPLANKSCARRLVLLSILFFFLVVRTGRRRKKNGEAEKQMRRLYRRIIFCVYVCFLSRSDLITFRVSRKRENEKDLLKSKANKLTKLNAKNNFFFFFFFDVSINKFFVIYYLSKTMIR